MATFEGYERRIDKITAELNKYGIKDIEEAKAIVDAKGIDTFAIVRDIQPIAFENACWAYTVGAAIAIKTGASTADKAAEAIGIGLQAFCIPGSVADQRVVGRGHGNLAAMLLRGCRVRARPCAGPQPNRECRTPAIRCRSLPRLCPPRSRRS